MEMIWVYVRTCLIRIILPAIFLISAYARPSILSSIYLILSLASPWLTLSNKLSSNRFYLLVTAATVILTFLLQSTYQVYEYFKSPGSIELHEYCNASEFYQYLQQIGMIRIGNAHGWNKLRVVLPEVLSFSSTALIIALCVSLPNHIDSTQPSSPACARKNSDPDNQFRKRRHFLLALGKVYGVLISLFIGFVSIIQPSVLNGVYFITLLITVTLWSSYMRHNHDTMRRIRIFLISYIFSHLYILYIYQLPILQAVINGDSLLARIFGLVPILHTNCNKWWSLNLISTTHWTGYLNNILLLLLYQSLIAFSQWTNFNISAGSSIDCGSSIHEELLSDDQQEPSCQAESRRFSVAEVDCKIIASFIRDCRFPVALSRRLFFFTLSVAHNFYIIALFSMMVWALLYHSIFGLIFLIASCLLIVFKDARRISMKLSPVFFFYALTLLSIEYICGFYIANEWPKSYLFDIFGIELHLKPEDSMAILIIKCTLCMPLVLLLRLYNRGKFYDSAFIHHRNLSSSYGTFESRNYGDKKMDEFTNGLRLVSNISELLTKYWIFAVVALLLIISIQTPVLLYNLIYFTFFAVFLIVLQISVKKLRQTTYLFWTSLILYTSIILIIIYCYQFKPIPSLWGNLTHFNRSINHDIGLINYADEGVEGLLIIRLSLPILFFIAALAQLKFFHEAWINSIILPMEIIELNLTRVESSEGVASVRNKSGKFLDDCREILWRLSEIHIFRLILLCLTIFAVNDVCVLNLVIIVLISLVVLMPTLSSWFSIFMAIYLSVFGIARMFNQMNFVPDINVTLALLDNNGCNYTSDEVAYSYVHWLGISKTHSLISSYLSGILVSLLILSLQPIIKYRQKRNCISKGIATPPNGIVFPDNNPADWDLNLINMFKFIFDYGFYKFGFEISQIAIVFVAWVRMDLLATLLMIWLLLFTISSRAVSKRLWPIFLLYLAMTFVLQYAVYVGLPPALCFEYPWNQWLSNAIQNDNLVRWLDLSNARVYLIRTHTIADLILLIIVSSQDRVFSREGPSHAAGDNETVYKANEYKLSDENPHYDFLTYQKSCVDFIKVVVFFYGHWVTVILILTAGLGGISLFALGYILLSFWTLWNGTSLYTMITYPKTIKLWRVIIIYNVFVMLCKVALQILGCAFIHILRDADLCYIRQLLSIVCVSEESALHYYFSGQLDFDNKCPVQVSETKIGFDLMAFAITVFQLRILNSWYFQHCIFEFRCEAVLMNRGAILKNQLIEKEMQEQNNQQRTKFDDIKKRTAEIRHVYNEQQRFSSYEGIFIPKGYAQAKRAGDYFMFDYDPYTDEFKESATTFIPEVTPGATDYDKLNPSQLIHAAVQHDLNLKDTLVSVKEAQEITDEENRMLKAVTKSEGTSSDRRDTISNDLVDTLSIGEYNYIPKERSVVGVVLHFIWKVFLSALGWLATYLNRISREHRYVAYVLKKEKSNMKNILKEGVNDVSQPLSNLRSEFDRNGLHCVTSQSDIEKLEVEAMENWEQRNTIIRFILALSNCVSANTEIMCYLFAIINHARSAGLLSLPLPLLVLLWGSLSSPRPARPFWIVMIAYTQLSVVIKFICQFGFFPWNDTSFIIKMVNAPNYWPGILGIRKEDYYAFWDIALLVALFFHRYMLRKFGLWKDANISDTFVKREDVPLSIDAASSNFHDVQVVTENNEDTYRQRQMRGKIAKFFNVLFYPKFRYMRDMYPFMFICDVICFLIVAFGYSSFGYGGSGSVISDISSNRVPVTFVVLLIVISLMIVIDRAMYLRKAVLSKLTYQIIIIILLHIWIFFILPTITFQSAWANRTAQLLYIVKCIYLLISAWQIRNGYPLLCSGNLITHRFGLSNMIFFKIFMLIPFLFELRTSIDWTWADTSMPLFDYINMENFYANIYNLKCTRAFEKKFPAPRGVSKGVLIKYFMGIPMIAILILIVWLPLLAFSFLNRIGTVLPLLRVEMSISIEGYPPLYQIAAQGLELQHLSMEEYLYLQNRFSQEFNSSDKNSILYARQAVAFINEYTVEDVMKVKFRPRSQAVWSISDDSLLALKYGLWENRDTINAIIEIKFERFRSGKSQDPTFHTSISSLPLEWNSPAREQLIKLLNSTKSAQTVNLLHALPPYIIVPNDGDLKATTALLAVLQKSQSLERIDFTYSNMIFGLKSTSSSDLLWITQLDQNNVTASLTLPSEAIEYDTSESLDYIQLIAFVDRVFPTFISRYVQGGIIAMYFAVVLLLGKLIRGVVTKSLLDIIVTEIPNPDHLWKICLDIYLVREAKDFVLEQDLYAKLIFLFRSPETLVKWTRYKAKLD